MENNRKDWRDRLDQNESPMDMGMFWNSLESKIPVQNPGKKKRRFLFWLLFLLIGSGFIGTIIIFNKPKGKIAGQTEQQKNAGVTEARESSLSPIETQHAADEIPTSDATAVISQNQSSSAATAAGDSVHKALTKYQSENISSVTKTANTSDKKTGNNSNDTQIEETASSGNASPIKEVVSENKQDQVFGIENQNIEKNAMSTAHELAQNSMAAMEYLPTLSGELYRELNWNMGYVPTFDHAPKLNQEKSGWQYWMDLSYGIGMAQHAFKTSDPLTQSYLGNRSKYESTLESRLAVWENRLIHPSGFYVSSGLRYQTHITRFDWSKEEVKIEWKLADGFVQDAQGNQIAIRDSAWQQYREMREIRQHNTISSLDIPLNVGYIIRKKQFSIEIAAGVTANISQYTSGKQLNFQEQPVKWNATEELTYKKSNTGFGASAMFRASWYPTEYLGVFIQPSFHTDFSNRMNSGAGYEHKIDFVNIQAGVAFLLFREGR